jgi:hypothetical protein
MFRCISWLPARRGALGAAGCLVVAVLALPVPGGAQQPPSRIGNRWDNMAHQPTQGEVSAAERERGIAPPPQSTDAEIERLYRELLQGEQNGPTARPR